MGWTNYHWPKPAAETIYIPTEGYLPTEGLGVAYTLGYIVSLCILLSSKCYIKPCCTYIAKAIRAHIHKRLH